MNRSQVTLSRKFIIYCNEIFIYRDGTPIDESVNDVEEEEERPETKVEKLL